MFLLPSNNLDPTSSMFPELLSAWERSPGDFYSLHEHVPTPIDSIHSSFSFLQASKRYAYPSDTDSTTLWLSVFPLIHALGAQG